MGKISHAFRTLTRKPARGVEFASGEELRVDYRNGFRFLPFDAIGIITCLTTEAALSKTLFTPTPRAALTVADVLPDAERVSGGEDEDVFLVGACRVTCRYWTCGGDFVSKQILGCVAAVESGLLRSKDPTAAGDRVSQAESVVGVVGPEEEEVRVVVVLTQRFRGVLVDGEEAVLAEHV